MQVELRSELTVINCILMRLCLGRGCNHTKCAGEPVGRGLDLIRQTKQTKGGRRSDALLQLFFFRCVGAELVLRQGERLVGYAIARCARDGSRSRPRACHTGRGVLLQQTD
jgi:hypothetical protein